MARLGITFEIVPVVTSKETQAVVAPYLEPENERARETDEGAASAS